MNATARRLVAATLALALSFALCASAVPAAAAPAPPERPLVSLDHPASGEDAIRELGPSLPAVAAAHGKSAEALTRAFREDKTLNVDTKGGLFYREGALTPAEAAAATAASLPATAPLSDTFTLHSHPGSKRVIFLDFNGYVLTGTAWNGGTVPDPLVCPAWSLDGDPSTFNDAERTEIQQIWQRVAEDYAPFDVDVTTQDPGDAAITRDSWTDDTFGMRVVISPVSSYFGGGGIAYVGVFDSLGTTYKPALVFPEALGNSEKYIGEACAHEAGHTLGLFHQGITSCEYYCGQGTGETSWAPIMGCSYYSNVTQWSKGEYALANNTEDELAIMTSKGAAYRPDDYADTTAGATPLPAGGSLTAAGVIGCTGDVDVLSFRADAGPVTLAITPATRGADLDVGLELRDAGGSLLASAAPTSTLAASLSAPVAAGTYYVYVRGTGNGDPKATGYTNYGSLGNWSLTGTVPAPVGNVPPVALALVTPTQAVAPALCTFDGSASYDPDGSVVSWAWDFGDGTTGTGRQAVHGYATPGVYTATLTVTDAAGLTGVTTVTVTVDAANVAPTAVLSMPSNATAGTGVSFDGSASSDPDGSIASWVWSFGDGTTGSGAKVTHAYAAAGTYAVTLTVTDNAGATGTAGGTIVVAPQPAPAIHVATITLTYATLRTAKSAQAAVSIVDASGLPVSGATVSGTWSGAVSGTSSAVTGSNGIATLSSKSFKKTGTVTYAVTKVSKTGYVYNAAANMVTKASVALGSLPARTALWRAR